jgi:hypothetical protein
LNEAPIAAGLAEAGGEYAAAGSKLGAEGAEEGAVGSLLASASGIGRVEPGLFRLGTGGTGLSGSQWSLNFPGYNSLTSLFT